MQFYQVFLKKVKWLTAISIYILGHEVGIPCQIQFYLTFEFKYLTYFVDPT